MEDEFKIIRDFFGENPKPLISNDYIDDDLPIKDNKVYMNDKHWWEALTLEYLPDGSGHGSTRGKIESFLDTLALIDVIPPIKHIGWSGFYKNKENFNNFIIELKRVVESYPGEKLEFISKGAYEVIFKTHSGAVFVNQQYHNNCISITISLFNQELFKGIQTFAKSVLVPDLNKGIVKVLTQTQNGGLNFSEIGVLNNPLNHDTYNNEVIESFKYIIKELDATEPHGRLTIINGTPGSGKTFMLRSLISESSSNIHKIILQASMVSELDGPRILPVLLDLKDNDISVNRPICFFIEDADECLVTRDRGNMSAISTILNLCDGIVGQMLDIRIVATSNQAKLDMDDALLRPGRLSSHLEINYLNHEKARDLYAKLTEGKELKDWQTCDYTVAEIFKLSYDNKLEKIKKTKAAMGFRS